MQCLCKILFNAADSIVAVTRDFEWCFDIELSFGRSFVDGRSVQALPLVYLVNRAEKISFVIRQSRLVNSLPTSILYSHKFHKLCLIELSQEVLLLSATQGIPSWTTRYRSNPKPANAVMISHPQILSLSDSNWRNLFMSHGHWRYMQSPPIRRLACGSSSERYPSNGFRWWCSIVRRV